MKDSAGHDPKNQGQRNYFYRLDQMKVEAFAPEMTTSAGALVEGNKMYFGLVHKARGSGSQMHHHPFEQFNYVLKGTLKAWVDGNEELVTVGGLIHIPANTMHSIVATSEEDVTFLMVKEVTPMGVAGIPMNPNVTSPRYEAGFGPKAM